MTNVTLRPAGPGDHPFLWRMLTLAASMDGTDEDVIHAQANPDLLHYVEGFGRAGDAGIVALVDDAPIGAAWVRLAPPGPVSPMKVWSNEVPELAIATVPQVRGHGVGSKLLEALLGAVHGVHPVVALTVREGNAAVRLYERHGFIVGRRLVNRVGTTSLVMTRAA